MTVVWDCRKYLQKPMGEGFVESCPFSFASTTFRLQQEIRALGKGSKPPNWGQTLGLREHGNVIRFESLQVVRDFAGGMHLIPKIGQSKRKKGFTEAFAPSEDTAFFQLLYVFKHTIN